MLKTIILVVVLTALLMYAILRISKLTNTAKLGMLKWLLFVVAAVSVVSVFLFCVVILF